MRMEVDAPLNARLSWSGIALAETVLRRIRTFAGMASSSRETLQHIVMTEITMTSTAAITCARSNQDGGAKEAMRLIQTSASHFAVKANSFQLYNAKMVTKRTETVAILSVKLRRTGSARRFPASQMFACPCAATGSESRQITRLCATTAISSLTMVAAQTAWSRRAGSAREGLTTRRICALTCAATASLWEGRIFSTAMMVIKNREMVAMIIVSSKKAGIVMEDHQQIGTIAQTIAATAE